MDTITINPAVAETKKQLGLQTKLFRNVTTDISDAHARTRPNEHTNHIAWLTGHIVSTRFMLCNALGVKVTEPFPALYENGKGLDPKANYPSMADLTKDWKEVSTKLRERLEAISEEELNAEMPQGVPTGKTVIDFIGFIAHHEAYTIGQLGILRRFFGYEAMKYE